MTQSSRLKTLAVASIGLFAIANSGDIRWVASGSASAEVRVASGATARMCSPAEYAGIACNAQRALLNVSLVGWTRR